MSRQQKMKSEGSKLVTNEPENPGLQQATKTQRQQPAVRGCVAARDNTDSKNAKQKVEGLAQLRNRWEKTKKIVKCVTFLFRNGNKILDVKNYFKNILGSCTPPLALR
jgi:hypothetical protein